MKKCLFVFIALALIAGVALGATTIVVTNAPGRVGTGTSLAANPITATGDFTAAASTMEFYNDGHTILFVENQHTSTSTIAFTMPTFHGMTITSPSTIQAIDSLYIYGPFPTELYNDSNGKVQFTVSMTTTVFVLAIKN